LGAAIILQHQVIAGPCRHIVKAVDGHDLAVGHAHDQVVFDLVERRNGVAIGVQAHDARRLEGDGVGGRLCDGACSLVDYFCARHRFSHHYHPSHGEGDGAWHCDRPAPPASFDTRKFVQRVKRRSGDP
jgi:hypothetical protein